MNNKKIKLFDVDRANLEMTESVVNMFLVGKEVTKVFLSPGYATAAGNTIQPLILVVYEDTAAQEWTVLKDE